MSKSDEWCTPPEVLEVVRKVGGGRIDYDPCSNEYSQVNATRAGTIHEAVTARSETPLNISTGVDGLKTDWLHETVLAKGHLVFVNPPYSQPNLALFTAKAAATAKAHPIGLEIIMLVPAYTGDGWFQKNVFPSAAAIGYWKGRIRFWEDGKPGKSCARFSSCLVYWGSRPQAFKEACGDRAKVMVMAEVLEVLETASRALMGPAWCTGAAAHKRSRKQGRD